MPNGFRDDDGVWHDGPHRVGALAALDELREQLRQAEHDHEAYEKQARKAIRLGVRQREDAEARADRAEQENRRLRTALEEIATGEPPDDVWAFNVCSSGVEWAGKIARAALATAEEPVRKGEAWRD